MKPTGIEIRPADLTDPVQESALVEMLDEFARETSSLDGLSDLTRRCLGAKLRGLTNVRIWFAWDGQRAAGLAVCFIGFSTFQVRPLLNIHDLVVRPEWRGRGIGVALLHAVEAEANRLDCCKLTLEVDQANEIAMRLYRKFGFDSNPNAAAAFFTKPLSL